MLTNGTNLVYDTFDDNEEVPMTKPIYVTKRICAGLYQVGKPGAEARDTVEVIEHTRAEGASSDFWMARAEWDRYLYTDCLDTKRDAVANALAMLAERDAKVEA